ncbi:MAG TPA: M56 family metallopeptidase, partial [Verrucomicrobiae bacterium]|nr:M56 family metallopeptidase [Verrucomicrobiae bacterium]
MSQSSLPILWNLASGLGNHLWQSTVVALVIGLLTLALRQNHARTRHALWMAASLKFLVPFSLLVSLGSFLAPARHSSGAATPAIYVAVEQVSQPFTTVATHVTSSSASTAVSPSLPHLVPVLAAVWLCGFIAIILVWLIRWRKISAAMRESVPLLEGREVTALRRIERDDDRSSKPIALLLSQSSLEPGIFGIARPTLIWPEGMSEHLDDSHLEAILAHEVWHVRRRDNLFAALHMIIEAVFWFYPLVWWIGTRLIEERERACDEAVLGAGSERQVYAESILKVCEFCLGSPLPCVSGVTGADLKKRMVRIMSNRMLYKLDFARKILLSVAATLAIAIPVTFGLMNPAPSQAQSDAAANATTFSTVSIKASAVENGNIQTRMMFSLRDGSFVADGVTLQRLIETAYHVQESQISGPHDLLNKTNYDIQAKLDPSVVAAMQQQKSDGKSFDDQALLKSLLANQFKLATHTEVQSQPAYDLVVDENGAKIQSASSAENHMFRLGPGSLAANGAPVEFLAQQLSVRLGRTVVDKTGLKGAYSFN